MSSYLVHSAQISAMVSCGVALALKAQSNIMVPASVAKSQYPNWLARVDSETLTAIGKLIYSANAAGQKERYGDDDSATVDSYVFERDDYAARQDVGFLAALVANFDYQACEWSGWETSEAKAWLDWAIKTGCKTLPGYNVAPWGYDGAPDKPKPAVHF